MIFLRKYFFSSFYKHKSKNNLSHFFDTTQILGISRANKLQHNLVVQRDQIWRFIAIWATF